MIRSAAVSPIMIDGAFVLADVTTGMADPSATGSPRGPAGRASTTASSSTLIGHVPTWWW